MLESQHISERLQSELEIRFKHLGLRPKRTPDVRGENYALDKDKVHFRCTIGKDWLGYELYVDETVLGLFLGFSEDNDGYGVGGEEFKTTQDIFARTLSALDAFANNKLLIGKHNQTFFVAMPLSGGKYLLKTLWKRKKLLINFISYSTEEISTAEIRKKSFLGSPN